MFYGGQRRSGIVLDPFWDPLLSGKRSVFIFAKNKIGSRAPLSTWRLEGPQKVVYR